MATCSFKYFDMDVPKYGRSFSQTYKRKVGNAFLRGYSSKGNVVTPQM
jgi:hypothetical protein